MGKILGIFKAAIKNSMAYRFDMALSIIVAPAALIVTYFLWNAIYSNSNVDIIGGFALTELIAYFVMSWIVGGFSWTPVDNDLSYDIRHGNIVKELLKPINFIKLWFFADMGGRFLAVIIELIPIWVICLFLFNLKLNIAYLPFFIVALPLTFTINYLILSIVGMSAFWVIQNNGVRKLNRIFTLFLSGMLLPITFFPAWFQKLSYFLPYQYLTFVPVNIGLGKYSIPVTLKFLGLQIVWIFILYLLNFLVWRAAMKRVSAVGI